ncbi:PREDICTED: uncharacterized protein LOC109190653 [Ipomoea nil]|uniref:uncharacterized protein LOC109190653 n=1 Tax=Ipomoea nil TaxID=35883 RepID=UPI0009010E03|nr:PREDICTED: uncharacterized protein LOC109190653 [Ipomoea nil]
MTGEDWVEAAMEDDSMVVEMLLGLSQTAKNKAASTLAWRVRQRRSKPVTVSAKKPAERASPNTPLSWSGGTSGSGGVGGAVDGGPEEESSRPPSGSKPARNARSKVNETNEKTTTKKSRKKKTLAELKQEEVMLLKERRKLKKELAKIRVNLETQKATNENLKRVKVDLVPEQQPQSGESIVTAASNEVQETGEGGEDRVELPDLNLPLEDDDEMLLS